MSLAKLRHHISRPLGVLLAAVLIAGCGAGAKAAGRHGAGASSDASQLRREAGSICSRTNDELTTKTPAQSSRETIARIASANAVLENRTVAELGALAVPPSLQPRWHVMLEYRGELARQLAEYGMAEAAGETSRTRKLLNSKQALRRELSQAAAAGGFPQCARLG
jgi:hypothetical protein